MPRIRVPITNFQFGEISPSLTSRTDTKIYNASAKKVENFFLRNEGGLLRRFGTERIYEFDTTVDASKTQQCRLVPFIFSDDERYIVSFENAKIRVFIISPSTGAVSLTQTITQDVNSAAVPFSDSIITNLTFAQSGDVMFIAHQTFMIRMLVRTSLTAFELRTFNFDSRIDQVGTYQPYKSFHSASTTLDPSATTGNGITLTTSAAYFVAGHVGTTIRYHENEIEITAITSSTVATGNVRDKLIAHLDTDALETTDGTADVKVTFALHGLTVNDSVTISAAGAVGGIAANQLNGARTINEVIDKNVFVITAGQNANASVIGGGSPKVETHAPTTQWDEQSYSAYRGYPAAVAFHENRLWLGGTIAQPDAIWASRTGFYFDFDVGDGEDDDSLDLTASIGEINTIRHIVSNRDLQIFTSTSESYIPAFVEESITPTNAQIKRQTPYGSSHVRPQVFDGATLFVQKTGSVVREYIYSDSEAAYVATGISTLSPHLIKEPVQMAILTGAINRPESYAFVLNNDGSVALFNSNRAEQRAGWSEFTTQGKFHSVCVIDDRVFFVMQHDKGDGTQKLILSEMDEQYNLDFSDKFTGSAGVFNVSSHFANGAVVDVINGTDYLGKFTVAGGNVNVSAIQEITSAEIGYSFNVEAETLPVDAQVVGGPLTGQPRAINRVILDLNDTLSVSVNGNGLVIRQVTDDFSTDRQAVSGKKEFRLLGYSDDPTVKITQTSPLSLQVNGIIAEVAF